MKLLVRRDQRKGFLGKMVFALEVRIDMSAEERQLMLKYELQEQIIYQREAQPAASGNGAVDAFNSIVAHAMNLTVRAGELSDGKRFECKSIIEMLAAEEQIREAANNFALMLEAAAKFGGEEIIPIGTEAVAG